MKKIPWNKGRNNLKKHTKEHKEKISNTLKEYWKGKKRVPWNKGKKNIYSKETIKKMGLARFKNGKIETRGYVLIYMPNHPNAKKKYVWEHRLVVEKEIGRYLKPEEVVHHINEVKDDNKIENLMLFKSNAEHMKFHAKIRQFGMTNPILRQIEKRWKRS